MVGLLAIAIAVGLTDEARGQGSVESDRVALEALYHGTDGPNWINSDGWLSDASLSDWYGVETDEQGRVRQVELLSNGLSGPIPPELGTLTNLTALNLGENRLSGSIPSALGGLRNLELLLLFDNELTGSIPPALGNLTNLTVLGLSRNPLSGSIPPELGNLVALEHIVLETNGLSGSIPSELSKLMNVKVLNLWRNQLSGSIPSALGDLPNLELLVLQSNHLTGSIPAALCRFKDSINPQEGDVHLLCEAAAPLTPKVPAVVQQAVDDAIAAATNGEGLRTGGGPVTVPLDALFTFAASAVRQVTYGGVTFSASSTAPGVVSASTTADGPGVVLTPGADAGNATVTVDARPEDEPTASAVASVTFDVEVHAAVPALPAAGSVLLALLLSGGAWRRYRIRCAGRAGLRA